MVSDYGLLIRVTRTNESLWSLYCSTIPTQSGEGAIATDIPNVENTPNFLGFIVCPGYTDFSNGYMGFMATHQGLWSHSNGAEFD